MTRLGCTSTALFIWRHIDEGILIAILIIAVALSALLWDVGLTSDNQSLLYHSIHLLRDGGLYVRWFELNPPLIFFLYSVPAAAIIWLGMAPNHALYLFTWALCAWSLWAIRRALAFSSLPHSLQTRALSGAVCILLICALNDGVYGDRDHLLFILSLPWIIQMLFGLKPAWGTILPAAASFCIKPYNLAIAAALILLSGPAGLSVSQRLFSRSACAIAGIACLYAAIVLLWFPAYLSAIAPVSATTYSFIYIKLASKLKATAIFLLLVTLVAFKSLPRPYYSRTAWIGFIAGALLCYLLNGGWEYTYYLLITPIMLLGFCAAYQAGGKDAGIRIDDAMFFLRIFLILFILYTSGAKLWENRQLTLKTGYSGDTLDYISPVIRHDLAGVMRQPYIFISTGVWVSVLTDLTQPFAHVYAYDFLWPLPWLAAHPDSAQAERVRHAITDPLLRAIRDYPQALIVIDASPLKRGLPKNIDLMQFLRRYPDVDAALQPYVSITKINRCTQEEKLACAFTLWKR